MEEEEEVILGVEGENGERGGNGEGKVVEDNKSGVLRVLITSHFFPKCIAEYSSTPYKGMIWGGKMAARSNVNTMTGLKNCNRVKS